MFADKGNLLCGYLKTVRESSVVSILNHAAGNCFDLFFTAIFSPDIPTENRLSSIVYTDSDAVEWTTVYIYRWDGFLSRIWKYSNATLVEDTQIVRDGHLALQERDGANAVLRQYAWGANMGGGIGGLLNLREGGADYSYLYDGKGNVTSVLDGNQANVASYRYSAFGRLMARSGTLEQPYQYSTKCYDKATGLSYYGYRFYNSAIGRWMNRDPLGEAGGINLYGFVQNNPVNWVDPWGLEGTPGMSTGKAAFIINIVKGINYVVPVPLELVNPDPYVRSLFRVNPISGALIGELFFPTTLADSTLPESWEETYKQCN